MKFHSKKFNSPDNKESLNISKFMFTTKYKRDYLWGAYVRSNQSRYKQSSTCDVIFFLCIYDGMKFSDRTRQTRHVCLDGECKGFSSVFIVRLLLCGI